MPWFSQILVQPEVDNTRQPELSPFPKCLLNLAAKISILFRIKNARFSLRV